MKKIYKLLLILPLFTPFLLSAQTITLLEEDFEGATGSWNTTGNAVTNSWIVNICAGNGPSDPGSNSAYITKGGPDAGCGATGMIQYNYENASSGTPEFTIMYTTVDATCASNLEFTIDYKLVGEGYPGSPPTILDYGEIVYSTNGGSTWTTITDEFYNIPNWTTATVPIPASLNGTTFEFGILWNVDQSTINNPPLAVDNLIITGEDNTPPTITGCPSPDVKEYVDGSCNFSIPDYTSTLTFSDNCTAVGDLTITQNPSPGFVISGHGTTQAITITATDEQGNQSQCIFDVEILDDTPPDFNGCPSNQNESLDVNCEALTKDYTSVLNIIGDNCTSINDIILTQIPASGTPVSGHGTVQSIKVYVEDLAGNRDSCEFNVTYNDNTAPTLTCPPNTTAYVDNNCQYTVPDFSGDVSAVDNCTPNGSITISQNPTAGFNLSGTGNHTISIFAEDQVGNIAQCDFTLTLVDTLAPSLICPGPQSQVADANCESTIADYTGSSSAIDNCSAPGNIVFTQSPAAGTTVSGPSLPVTIYAEDESGNIDSCTFTLTLNDSQVPTINCPADFDVYVNNGCDYSIEDYATLVTVDDNCTPTASISITQSPGIGNTLSNHGTTQTITMEAEDASGNSNQCQFTITLQDTIAPTVSCPGDQNDVVGPGCQFSIPDYTSMASVNDNCSTSGNITITQNPAIGTNVIAGTHAITIMAEDEFGNIGQCTFDLVVNDNVAPTFSTCPGNTDIPADANCEVTLPDLTGLTQATDNCTPTGNITYSQSPAIGTVISSSTVVTVTATDNAGNTADCNITVNITDTTAPTINCPANQNIVAGNNCEYSIPNYTSLAQVGDNCVSFSSITITQSPTVGTLSSGVTIVTLYAEDPSGNIDSCSFDVIPTDNTAPVINSCPGTQTAYADHNCEYSLDDFTGMVNASDACGPVTLTQSPTIGTTLGEGFHDITVTVEDQSGNTSDCIFQVEVQDTLPPMLSCPSDFVSCDTIVTFPMPSAIDGCSPNVTISQVDGTGLSNGSDFDLGFHTLEFQAVDDNGNFMNCSFEIEVIQGPSEPDAGVDIELCNIFDTSLNANSPAFGTGEWIRLSGNGTPVDTYDPNTAVNGLSVGDNVFVWSISLGQCPPRNDTVVITVYEPPTQPDLLEVYETCDDTIRLEGNEALVGNGYWEIISGNATIADTTVNISNIFLPTNDTTQLVWHIENGACGTLSDTATYIHYENDLVAYAGPDLSFCDTASTVRLQADSTQQGYGVWSVISGVGGVSEDSLYNAVITNMNRDALTVYQWSVTHPNCGVTTDRVTAEVYSCVPFDFDIPTGFTPDNDGVNDTWNIPQLDKYYPNCSVTIVNRWGNMVYESTNGYDDPWDGRYNGNLLPVGSYYFVIDFNVDGQEPLTGTVTLIK